MMKLIPPGKRGPCWYIRGTLHGVPREVSTGTTEEGAAQMFLLKFIAHYDAEHERDRLSEENRRQAPAAVPLGEFEQWALETFELDGETVRWKSDRRRVAFFTTDGYRVGKIPFKTWRKSIREHRIKFLLAYGWLPETIDHIDRNRANNRLDNLRASTPALQQNNIKRGPQGLPLHEVGW